MVLLNEQMNVLHVAFPFPILPRSAIIMVGFINNHSYFNLSEYVYCSAPGLQSITSHQMCNSSLIQKIHLHLL